MDIQVQNYAVASLRRRPEVVEVAGFIIGCYPDSDSPYLNYATPLPGAEPTAADVAALVAAFRERGLKPRLEFAPNAAPAVEAALRAAGFTTEAEHEYLICTPATLAEPVGTPGSAAVALKVETPETDEEYLAVDAALAEAFSGEFASSPEGGARLRRQQEAGGAIRFVRAADGSCAGGAGVSPIAVGTTELAGVGTRPAHRGQGIAAAVVAELTRVMFDRGAESVWLEYSGEGSRRVYERVGFRPSGRRLYISLES
ncbi:GNAT family N-acetyltransferase [Kitasatospora sp. LaBMicrA B282]|uniref:GNAT family N-acetyltransferase n=1 Tax=Kitasatospora sp. LaBMicrA B282 TaxID=3420949 RepID=UPI003D11900F